MKNRKISYKILIPLIIALFYTMKTKGKSSLTKTNTIRPDDDFGSGLFGASRGTRIHNGLDFFAEVGEAVYAPFDMELKRHGVPYEISRGLTLQEYKGLGIYSDYLVKVLYVKNTDPIGTIYNKGEVFAYVQDVSEYHSTAEKHMNNHAHVEIYKNGKLIDPQTVLL